MENKDALNCVLRNDAVVHVLVHLHCILHCVRSVVGISQHYFLKQKQ